jgi:hypothetical protein
MPKGVNLQCAAGKTARIWLQRKGGKLLPGQALVLLPIAEGETDDSPFAYRSPLRQALLDDNAGHVNLQWSLRHRCDRHRAGHSRGTPGAHL